jgi:hypothetical protein
MFKITNSTNLVKALFSKTSPTRFQGNNKIQLKIRIFLPSWKPKNPKNEEKHLKLQIIFAKHLVML